MELKDRQVVILGAARSGLAAAELAAKNGATVFVSDIAPQKGKTKIINKLKGLGIPFEFGGHSNRVYSADLVVLSPGIPQTSAIVQSIRQKGIPVFSEIELAYRFCKSPIIAVTGSNGKTTTTTLIGKMLKKQMSRAIMAGNIGYPFSAYVTESDPDQWAAVEVSSFQLETIDQFHPRVVVLLNLSPNHMDWYKTYQDYVEAKLRIIKNLDPTDLIIFDGDDPKLFEYIVKCPARKIKFSSITTRAEACLQNDSIYFYNHETVRVSDITLRGVHNYKNIMAAGLACMQAGIEKKNIVDVAKTFTGVEHRLEHVATIRGIKFINDSKATTLESLAVALQSFKSPVVLIAGGKDKGADYTKIKKLVEQHTRKVILIGSAADKIARAWSDVADIIRAGSMDEAVKLAFQSAGESGNVLLSPACSSFDMFKDYEHRGREFKNIVKRIVQEYESKQTKE
jgi:UDP-N-acetylmuramoylalanine--D-glutamate ligase